MPILQANGLVKIYGTRRVVDGVDFDVSPGEIVGLLGPNGAGKTTSFRMTCGMIEPNAGKVFLNGVDVTDWPMYRRARDGGMGYLAQESSVFRKLSVQDNLLGMMEMLGVDRKTRRRRCDGLLEQFNIAHLRKNLAMSLSGGEKRRLEIARALATSPRGLLLDEPAAGLNPEETNDLIAFIRDIKDRYDLTILVIEHNLRLVMGLCQHLTVLDHGLTIAAGTPAEIRKNPEVIRAYLGK